MGASADMRIGAKPVKVQTATAIGCGRLFRSLGQLDWLSAALGALGVESPAGADDSPSVDLPSDLVSPSRLAGGMVEDLLRLSVT